MFDEDERELTALLGRLHGMFGTVNIPAFTRIRTDNIGAPVIVTGNAQATNLTIGGVTPSKKVFAYGKALAEQAGLHQDDLTAIRNVAAAEARNQQDKRLALEQRLSISDKNNYEKLTNAERYQARLRDRLATTELRLSVLLDAADTARRSSVPTGAIAAGMDDGGTRAELDTAHAQRIIGITGEGDRGLIALAACQGYVREIIRQFQN